MTVSDPTSARLLGKASIEVSIAGVIVGVVGITVVVALNLY